MRAGTSGTRVKTSTTSGTSSKTTSNRLATNKTSIVGKSSVATPTKTSMESKKTTSPIIKSTTKEKSNHDSVMKNIMEEYKKEAASKDVNIINLTSPEDDLYSIKDFGGQKQFASHVEHLAGPILFSAPHGLHVYRGGEVSNDSERIHNKELFTNEICLLLSLQVRKYLGIEGSFIIWNQKTAKTKDKNNLDPNYLVSEQFMSSPFHLFLHKLKEQYGGFPTLHIDIHGKINRKDNRNIDIGIAPMMALWKDQDASAKVKKDFCQRMQLAVNSCKKTYSGFKLTIDKDPYLSGYWGDDTVTTISHQSILLDMPALQLEIPMDVRKDLMANASLLDELCKAIAETYKNSVTSIFNMEWRQVEVKIDETKSALCSQKEIKHNSSTFDSMINQMIVEFCKIEKSQTGKKI